MAFRDVRSRVGDSTVVQRERLVLESCSSARRWLRPSGELHVRCAAHGVLWGRSARRVRGTQSARPRALAVPPSPYRFLAGPAPDPTCPSRGPSLEIAVAAGIAWALGLVRVTCA